MKNILYHWLLPLLLLVSGGARAQTTLQQESFENPLGSASSQVDVTGANTAVLVTPNGATATTGTATATSSSTDQYYLRTSNATVATDAPGFQSTGVNGSTLPTNVNGTYYWAGEGVKGTDATVATPPTRIGGRVTLKPVSVAGYASLKVTVALFIARGGRAYDRMENDDTLRVQVRFNGAGNWITVGQLVGDNPAAGNGGYWRVDAGRDGSSADDVAANTPTVGNPFSDFTFNVAGSGSTMQTRIVVAEQGGSEEFAFDNIRVTGVMSTNQAPVLANLEGTTIAYSEGQGATQLTNALTVSDDGSTLTGATVAFGSTGFDNTEDQLLFTNQNGITGSYNSTTGVLTLSGTASLAAYQAALRSIQYQDIDAVDASPGTRTVSFSVTDGLSTSLAVSRSITVTAFLDAAGGLPYVEDLETNGEGTRYTSNDGLMSNGRAFIRTNVASEPNGQWHSNGSAATTISGINNSYYWWASGTSIYSGGTGTFITKQTNTAGYTNLNFSVKLAASNNVWEIRGLVKVYYRLNGGSWVPLISFRSTDQTTGISTTGNLARDANPATTTGASTGAQLTPTLTTFTAALPAAANGQLVDFRIDATSDSSDGVGEVIGFDYLQLTGTPPTTVTSIVPAAASPTNASSVAYTVTFASSITGLSASNFATAPSAGITGSSVTAVSGAGTTYTVTVNTGSGSGTLGLTLANATGLSAGISNAPFTGTPVYTIDKTAPTVTITSGTAATGGTTTTTPLAFTATFSESVTGFVASDVTVTNGSITGNVSGSGTTYTFSVTPTTAGTATTVSVPANVAQDGVGNPNTASNTYSITYTPPALVLAPATLPGGTVGAAYSQTITASGGTAPYTFAVTSGALPAGFALTASGVLAGTPTAGGSFNFTIRATDNIGTTGSQTYTLAIAAPSITVAPATLPGGTAGIAYSQTFTASGGTAPYTFAVTSGALPNGLTLTASGGLSGTPTAGGSFTFTVAATDASTGTGPYTGPRTYTLTINPALTATVSSTAGTSGTTTTTSPIPFSVSFSQSVGTSFVASDVTVTGGTLTSGSLAGSGSGPYSFTVTPSGPGTVAVSVAAGVATDANNTPNTASNTYRLLYQLPTTTTPTLVTPPNGSTVSGLPTFMGTAPVGSTVTLYLVPNGGTSQVLATLTIGGSGSFSYVPTTALASGSYAAYATAQSSGSNVSANSNTNSFVVDATAPTVLSINRQSPAASLTNATSLMYRVTFSEAVTGVDGTDFSLTGTGTASGTSPASTAVSTSVYDVTVSGVAGDGTLRLDLKSTGTGIADQVGNASDGYTSGQPYTLDHTAPTATISTTATSPTTTSPIPFTVTFSEAVTGFSASSVTVTNGTITGSITSSGNAYSFSVAPTAAGSVTVAVAANGVQDAAGNGNTAATPLSVTYTVPATLTTWTGAVSADWFTAGNWTAGVPTATLNATIPVVSSTRYPLIAAGTATTRALTLASGATLTMSGGTLDAQGTWTNNGTFAASGGTVQLGGQTGSIVGSSTTTFWNLTTSGNAVNLNTSAGLAVRRLLTTNTNLLTNGNLLRLLSDATGTAMSVNPTAFSVVGASVEVQRYIGPAQNPGPGYRHLASPTVSLSNTQGTQFADLATATFQPLVNPAYNTSATPTATQPFPNIFGYDQSRLTTVSNNLTAFEQGYYSPAALSDRLSSGFGYTINLAANQTVTFKGELGNGDLTRSLSRNAASSANAADAGWQLLGNPYPSPYDYSQQASGDRQNLDAAIYVYQSTSQYAGQYRTILGTIGDPILPMGQAFFARVSAGQTSGTITYRNANRVTTYQNPTFQRTAEARPLVQLTLQGTSSPLLDEVNVYFENGATTGFEPAYDAVKLPNPTGLNLSTSVTGYQLAIDGQAPLASSQRVVPLTLGVPAAGSYALTAAQLLNLNAVPVYLRDLLSGAVVDLRQQPTYQFTVSNAAALLTGRFELVFSPQQPLATVPAALAQQVALYPNPARTQVALELPLGLSRQPVTASLVDALGRVVRQQVLPANLALHTLPLTNMASGVYSLRLTTELGTLVKKLVIE